MVRFGRISKITTGALALYAGATIGFSVADAVRSPPIERTGVLVTRYAIAVAPGAAVYADGRPHPHTANRVRGVVEYVNFGKAAVGVMMSEGTAEPMKRYAVRELKADPDKIRTEDSSYSFVSELQTIKNRTLREHLKSVNGKYPDDLRDLTVYLMMQEWAADRLRQDAEYFLRYDLRPYDPRVALPLLGRVFGKPGRQIPFQVIVVEDGRNEAEVERDRNLERRLTVRGIKMPFGKKFVDAFGRNLPFSHYTGDWYIGLVKSR